MLVSDEQYDPVVGISKKLPLIKEQMLFIESLGGLNNV